MHGRNPTRREKGLLNKWKLNPDNWLVTKTTTEFIEIMHRYSGKTRKLPEGIK
ncbi:MAG: hypothetical protein PHH48_03455 [Eubacteriales bacterium]|nr:hypothetical protein [Eubacteriales bacterium]